MPVYRTGTGSSNLNMAMRRAAALRAGGSSPLLEIEADQAAARTARDRSLADKARAEADAVTKQNEYRSNPQKTIEYGADVSGLSIPDAARLHAATRGAQEPWSAADQSDADQAGVPLQPYAMAKPNMEPGQERRFRGAIASVAANMLATGKTNADQITKAGGELQSQSMLDEASRASGAPEQNQLIAAATGKLRYPYAAQENRETGDLTNLGEANVGRAEAQAGLTDERATTEGSRRTLLAERAALAARSPGSGLGLRVPGETEAQRQNREAIARRHQENAFKAQRERADSEFRLETRTNPKLSGAKLGQHLGGSKYAIVKDGKVIGEYELPR